MGMGVDVHIVYGFSVSELSEDLLEEFGFEDTGDFAASVESAHPALWASFAGDANWDSTPWIIGVKSTLTRCGYLRSIDDLMDGNNPPILTIKESAQLDAAYQAACQLEGECSKITEPGWYVLGITDDPANRMGR